MAEKLSRKELEKRVKRLQEKEAETTRAIEELRTRNAYLEHVFESVPDAVVLGDEKHHITGINKEFSRMFGYTLEEASGHTVDDLIALDKHTEEASEATRLVEQGETISRETVRYRKDGTPVWVELLASPIWGAGKKLGTYASYRDITARKHTEMALRESEERYRDLIENSNDLICTHDLSGRILSTNSRPVQMLGYEPEEFARMNIRDILAPETRSRFELYLEELTTQGFARGLMRVQTKSGEHRFWEYHNTLRTKGVQEPIVRGIARDVTEKKRAEDALKESERRYRQLFNSFRDAILVADTDRNIIDCNQAFKEEFQYTLEEIKGKKTSIVYDSQKEYEKMGEEIRKHIDQPHFLYTINYKRKSGEIFPGETNVFFLKNGGGKTLGFIGMIRDVTEARRAEAERSKLQEQLRQAQKMEAIGRLAGGVAHDFNNLLTTILGHAEMALMDLKNDEPLYKVMEEIRGAGERASGLTRQLLAFSRRQILQPEVLDLNKLLPGMDKMLRRIIGEDIELETLLAPDLGLVEADPGQVEQVIMNLAVNARDAMPGGGKLTLETANTDLNEAYSESHGRVVTSGPYVMLAVSDSGFGMTPEIRAQVFDPFFTTKEKGKGTGLGLSTVYGIVKQSNGYIWVYSEPGEGTSFKIYLPRVEKNASEKPESETRSMDLRGSETVLVIEDDEAVRNIALKNLRRYGYTPLDALDGEEALRLFEKHRDEIHLVLTDVVMPGKSGKEVVDEIMGLAPKIKVLYMSGYTDNAIVHHGVLDQDVAFIQKPFTPEDLVKKVRETLDREQSS